MNPRETLVTRGKEMKALLKYIQVDGGVRKRENVRDCAIYNSGEKKQAF